MDRDVLYSRWHQDRAGTQLGHGSSCSMGGHGYPRPVEHRPAAQVLVMELVPAGQWPPAALHSESCCALSAAAHDARTPGALQLRASAWQPRRPVTCDLRPATWASARGLGRSGRSPGCHGCPRLVAVTSRGERRLNLQSSLNGPGVFNGAQLGQIH